MKRSSVFVLFIMLSLLLCAYGKKIDMKSFLPDDLLTYSAKAEILITLPITQQDVRYTAKIVSLPSCDREKQRCASDYLIEIEDSLRRKSVYSYFDGNYFAYSGGKLREYHWERDSLPFIDRVIKGKNVPGVHKSGLFSFLIPGILREQLEKLSNNVMNEISYNSDSPVAGQKVTVIELVEYIGDVPLKEMKFVVDGMSHKPIFYQIVTSPGTLSEQIMEICFEEHIDNLKDINEQLLIARYSDVFANYREDNFSVNSLVGKSLPMFSLPSIAGERYIWDGNFNVPTLLVFLRSGEGMTKETVRIIKQAVHETPLVVGTLWLFEDKNIDTVIDVMDGYADDYTVLFNAQRFAARCGIIGTPTVLIVDKSGKICSVSVGYSPELKQDLIQRLVHIKDYTNHD